MRAVRSPSFVRLEGMSDPTREDFMKLFEDSHQMHTRLAKSLRAVLEALMVRTDVWWPDWLIARAYDLIWTLKDANFVVAKDLAVLGYLLVHERAPDGMTLPEVVEWACADSDRPSDMIRLWFDAQDANTRKSMRAMLYDAAADLGSKLNDWKSGLIEDAMLNDWLIWLRLDRDACYAMETLVGEKNVLAAFDAEVYASALREKLEANDGFAGAVTEGDILASQWDPQCWWGSQFCDFEFATGAWRQAGSR